MRRRAAALLLLFLVACHGAKERSAAPAGPDVLYARGREAYMRGDYNVAEAVAREGETRFATEPAWHELFAVLEAQCIGRKNPKAALALLERTPATGAPQPSVRRLIARGYALAALGRAPDADATYVAADALAARVAPALQPEIAMRRVATLYRPGNADEAKRSAHRAIDGAAAAKQTWVLASAYGNLAYVEMRERQWREATEHYRLTLQHARAAHAKAIETAVGGNLGWCYLQLGDFDEAMTQFRAALDFAEKRSLLDQQHAALTNIADVNVSRLEFAAALPYARRALDTARHLDDARKIANSLNQLGQIELELRHYDAAAKLNAEALAIRIKNHDGEGELYSRVNEARILAATGDPARALEILDAVIASRKADPPMRWRAQAVEAKVYSQLGRLGEAERMYEATLATGDDTRARESAQGTESFFAFERNLIGSYDEYIDLLLQEGRAADALRLAERSRARTLRDAIGLDPSAVIDPPALARAKNATILCYWLGPRRSLLWTVTPAGVDVATLPPEDDIDRDADAYRAELQAPRHSLASALGAKLYATLVAPAKIVPSSRVIILPDAHLNALSFETLIAPAPRPHYWIEDVTVSYSPSLHLLATTPAWHGVRDARVLVVGNVPAEGREFPALARARDEIARVVRHFDLARRVVIEGITATPASYAAAKPDRFDFIHFTAHATASTRTPLDSSVILAPGANGFRLSGRDIVDVPLAAELVTVSSCNSAGRRSYAGEGLVGLAWAFMRAGAHRVVAAQWEVSDSATPQIMDRMYAAIGSGLEPAAALRQAKLALLRSNSVYERPFYWAPFVVYGAI
jgi:CHAT domain-containing protein/Tfp pilus assembly protein PilF